MDGLILTTEENLQNIYQLFQKKLMGCDTRKVMGVLGCLGGMLIHIVIGSFNQWGITNVYITSYFRTLDSSENLQKNAIAYPLMMICIGLTMKLGLFLSEKTHPILVLSISCLMQVGTIMAASFTRSMALFIVIYGIFFGLLSGINFMIPVYECNKYFPNMKMYVNGVILMGTGLGPLVFGLYSYNFLNPSKLPTKGGYYNENEELQKISAKVPEYLRWLALIYLFINALGISLLYYVCKQNRRQESQVVNIENLQTSNESQIVLQKTDNINEVKENSTLKCQSNNINPFLKMQVSSDTENNLIKTSTVYNENTTPNQENTNQLKSPVLNQPSSLKEALCSKVWWLEIGIIFFGSCGLFLMNGNYKTYVKTVINNDQFLTTIGVVASVVNGCCRFLWNVLLNHTGYRFIILLNILIQIIIYSALRFSVESYGGFMLLIILINLCLGGFLGTTPTFVQLVFGVKVGSNAYFFFWEIFGVSNMIQYAFVNGLAPKITFNGIIYICLGMSIFSGFLVIVSNFEAPWKNSLEHLGYFNSCNKKNQDQKQKQNQQQNQKPKQQEIAVTHQKTLGS